MAAVGTGGSPLLKNAHASSNQRVDAQKVLFICGSRKGLLSADKSMQKA